MRTQLRTVLARRAYDGETGSNSEDVSRCSTRTTTVVIARRIVAASRRRLGSSGIHIAFDRSNVISGDVSLGWVVVPAGWTQVARGQLVQVSELGAHDRWVGAIVAGPRGASCPATAASDVTR